MAMEEKNGNYELPISIVADGQVKKTLKTADTYVDKDIDVVISVADATYEVEQDNAITATASVADAGSYLTDTESPFAIELHADASVSKATVGVAQAGFAAESDKIDVSAKIATQDKKTKYIKAGSLADPAALAMSVNGSNIDLIAKTEQPASGFYVKTNASGAVKVGTAGWIAKDVSKSVSGEAYYSVPTLGLANAATSETTVYADISETAPVLVSGDYLYLNEGYIENSKIALSKLVPDGSNVTGQNDLIYKTISAYDNDGNLVAGSMDDAELSAITTSDVTANISEVSVAADAIGHKFNISGEGAISGSTSVAISQTGYATTDLSASGSISGQAALAATLDVADIAADVSGDGTVKPVIRDAGSNARVAAVASAAPTDKKYVAVDAAAIAKTVTITPKVTAEGYATAALVDVTGNTATAGSEAADKVYIAIENGSHEVSHTQTVVQETIAISMNDAVTAGYSKAGILTNAPADAPYITISTSNTSTAGSAKSQASCTASEGYILSGTINDTEKNDAIEATVTQAANKYIRIYTGEVI